MWKLLDSSEIRNKVRDLFTEEIIKSIELSGQLANYLVSESEKKAKMQPELRIGLLTEDRDKYLQKLANTYVAIDMWYYNYWNEETQSVKHPGALEWDIFLYCQNLNKPFIVLSKMLSDMYGYFQAVSRYNVLIQQSSSISTGTVKGEEGLSNRQRILKYFYEGGMMVERKHKDYNDYNKFCTARKRLSYSNDSQSKLKPLIDDIEKIKNLLTKGARQIAEAELDTLKLRLTVEN